MNSAVVQITLPLIVTIFVAVWIGNHQLEVFSKHIDERFNDLREFIRSEIKRLEDRIERLEHPILRS